MPLRKLNPHHYMLIRFLIAAGDDYKQHAIARMCGYSPKYVTELKRDALFRAELEQTRQKIAAAIAETQRERKHYSTQELLDKLEGGKSHD
ncbi:MAG TPA: hypothetical protein GXX51_11415 [Firmicutes bacterium]|nr:hypothetical protein [Bacillota bacterium]